MLDEGRGMVLSHKWALGLHGFYVDFEAKKMRFDVVFSFEIDLQEGERIVREQVSKAYPDYDIVVTADVDLSD